MALTGYGLPVRIASRIAGQCAIGKVHRQIPAQQGIRLCSQTLLLHLAGKSFAQDEIVGVDRHLAGGMRKDVASRHIDIAGDACQQRNRPAQLDGVDHLVQGAGNFNAGGLGGGKQPGGLYDQPFFHPGDLGHLGGAILTNPLAQLRQAHAIALDVLAVIEAFAEDHVQHAERQRGIGAGARPAARDRPWRRCCSAPDRRR